MTKRQQKDSILGMHVMEKDAIRPYNLALIDLIAQLVLISLSVKSATSKIPLISINLNELRHKTT
jgi:hypothetical protein